MGGMDILIDQRVATPEEYRRLCEAVGWGDVMNFDAAARALPGSLYGVVAVDGGEVGGMGRVVGDGEIFFYVQDVAVLPSHQGRGAGRAILEALVGWVREHAPDKALLGLFASRGTEGFYRRHGFVVPTGDVGMFQVVRR